jgi:hypothetical protein
MNRRLWPFIREHRVTLAIAFLVLWCATGGVFMWRAKTTSPTFLEAELASCVEKCSPKRAELETTRPERVYQQPSWRGPASKYPECKCF